MVLRQLASRVGWMIIGCVCMVGGIIGKIGAFLAICPDPIIGGFSIVGMGMIIAVGLSCLRHCNMRSVRNLVIIGSSIMLGLMVPYYMGQNPEAIDTGMYTVSSLHYNTALYWEDQNSTWMNFPHTESPSQTVGWEVWQGVLTGTIIQ